MDKLFREKIGNEIYFSSLRPTKFKTMRITIAAFLPLLSDKTAENALLSQVLSRSCKEYKTFKILERKLMSLYGASLYSDVKKVGDRQCISFTVSALDDRYAFDNTKISSEITKLLCSILFEPNVDNNGFVANELEQSKRQVLDMIDSEFNDKRMYSVSNCVKLMCENDAFGADRFGTKEQVNAVTENSLYKAWQHFLNTARFEIIYAGESSADDAKKIFSESFSKISRTPAILENKCLAPSDTVKEKTEEMEVAQAKLVMGITTEVATPSENVPTLMLLSAVLGGTPSSKFFLNVREKQSLCYYCLSRYNANKGFLLIESGVQSDNVEKAKKAILNEIDEMKNGNITDLEISSAKLAMANAFSSVSDTVSSMVNFYLAKILDEKITTPEQLIESINKVTKEQLVEFANKLKLNSVYVLKNKE